MTKDLEIFFSNHLEILYHQLKKSLFDPSFPPLIRRLVVVSGPAMKSWIMLKMAADPELNVAIGIEFVYLNQAFDFLLQFTHHRNCGHFPTPIELALAIENELRDIFYHFENLDPQEQSDWIPLIQYLKLNPNALNSHSPFSRKSQRRLIALSQQLALLFRDYGRFGAQMVERWEKWENTSLTGWQPRLWRRLFTGKFNWSYPSRNLSQNITPNIPFTLHFFSISFISAKEFDFISRLSKNVTTHYYLLSPCAVFWSDIRSDRENAYIHGYWQKKLGKTSPQLLQLDEFLRDRNPLLANYGRMGREMACQIEVSNSQTYASYVLPNTVKNLDEDFFLHNDIYLTESNAPFTLLHALQADLLMLRNPQESSKTDLEERASIQFHIAPNKRREIEILYHNLLSLIEKDPTLSPGDIIVMAPQITQYVPFIQSFFGSEKSQMDFQILDLGMQLQNEIVQGFIQLIELCECRWDTNSLLQIFKHPSFQRRHQFSSSDYTIIQKWVEEASIRWGESLLHRNKLLQRNHCDKGMVDETLVGTWDYGLSRLLHGLIAVVDENSTPFDTPPCSGIDFSQSELLGKWIHLLHSLRDDLSLLEEQTEMTIDDWINFLTCLLDNYFQPDPDDYHSIEEYEDLKAQFKTIRLSSNHFKESLYPFATVKAHLISLLENRGMTYREERLHGVRFCSFMPLRSIPAKVIALLGMAEGAFPRLNQHTSLNLMIKEKDIDYFPSPTDEDRYLFLEALHSAQDYFLCSYPCFSHQNHNEQQPSLVIQELFSYLDKFYTIEGKRISHQCIFKHPYDSFDERYFVKGGDLHQYSEENFRTAQVYYQIDKSHPHAFLKEFIQNKNLVLEQVENQSQIHIKHLTAAIRNPIKFYLNQGLDIYLKSEEDRKIKTEEEWVVHALDKFQIKHSSLKEPLDFILEQADKCGKLPFGLFKDVALKNLKREIEEIQNGLLRHEVEQNQIFQIDFCTSCSDPIQLDRDRWLFPAPYFNDEKGNQCSIVGKLSHVSSKGLIYIGKGSLTDVWKIWPQFLLYCHAVKICPKIGLPQLIFSHASQPKEAFFEDPNPYFKGLVQHYRLCSQNFLPLIPDWIPLILNSDTQGLEDKMHKLFAESFGGYQNDELRWILHPNRLPDSKHLLEGWKSHTENLLEDMIQSWFPSQLSKTSGMT